MAIDVFSEEWSHACCAQLNGHQPYKSAASGWEGAIVMVMRADPKQGLTEDRAAWFDLHRGECRGARMATPEDRESAPYVMSAVPSVWKQVFAREMEPISAIMFGKLKLERGSMFTLARYTTAAKEMVVAAGMVEAVFPGEEG
jgi:putative sterol carrier protein